MSALVNAMVVSRRIAFEYEGSSRVVVGAVWSEEIDAHPGEFLGAIAGQRPVRFVIEPAIVLFSWHLVAARAEFDPQTLTQAINRRGEKKNAH